MKAFLLFGRKKITFHLNEEALQIALVFEDKIFI